MGYETDGINNNNFIYHYIYLAIIIIINFAEDFKVISGVEVGFEISGIGIGISGIGIGIETYCE